MSEHDPVPRGRHAPPLELRQDRRRRRLDEAAAAVFGRVGCADAAAEAIARAAGMSKATFYEHFANQGGLHQRAVRRASERLLREMQAVSESDGGVRPRPARRYRRSIAALLGVMADHRDQAQTLLAEIIGAGPRAMERRDRVLSAFAGYIDERNEQDATAGLPPRLASPDDAFAIVGAVIELASRQLRTGVPEDIRELEPVIERLIVGLLAAAGGRAAPA